jgi:hypothetical protein
MKFPPNPIMKHLRKLVALILLTILHCNASTIPIVDSLEAFPFLRSVDNPANVLRWDTGTMVQLLSSCKLIRVTRRGIRCIAASDQLAAGWELQFTPEPPVDPIQGFACLARNNALCETIDGRRFFPTDGVYVSDLSVGRCRNGQGRWLIPETDTGLHMDDVSLCDVLDTNLDVVYDPVNNRIFTKQLGDSLWLYTVLSILILVVVVLTAETVSHRSQSKLTHNIVAWVLLAGTSLLMLTRVDGRMHPFITVNDAVFLYISGAYITASTLYWAKTVKVALDGNTASTYATETPVSETLASDTQRDGINAMIGSIHFATCVLYGTVDNAYVAAFFFVFLFRCLQKLHDAHISPDQWTFTANTVLLLDVTYTALIFYFGVYPHYTDHVNATLYAVAQYVICEMVASNCATSSPRT